MRPAKSGKASFSDPIVIHETTRTRISVVPFFIKHSDHTELAVKIVTDIKKPAPFGFVLSEDKSVSLRETAARRLLAALGTHLKAAECGEDGNYLVIRISEGTATLGAHDPQQVAQALTKVLSQPELVRHLDKTELSEEFLCAFRSAIRLKEMISAVSALRQNLKSRIADESVYQTWCEKHTWAFGSAYVMRDSVRDISPGDRLDLLLPTVIAGYRDIIELKRPDMKVLLYDEAHRNFYFSADVSKAIGQCHRYLDVLHEDAANGLRDHPEIVAYHPRAIIVIGRSEDWDESRLRALHGLNGRLSCLTVMTYDQLLAQGERLIEMVAPRQTEGSSTWLSELDDGAFGDDDVPF
jgi:hypothetical protein